MSERTHSPTFAEISGQDTSVQIFEMQRLEFYFFPWLTHWSEPSENFDAYWLPVSSIAQRYIPDNHKNWAWMRNFKHLVCGRKRL